MATQPDFPFRNPDLSIDERVQDLLDRLTLEEKVSQMVNDAAAVPRLGLEFYNWWNECLHGVGRAGRATVFPQAIGLASAWDQDLMHRVATAISDEARAKHHQALRQGNRCINLGLTYWTPTINILRDPRWGRGQETYGEDPYLTSALAVPFIRGLQGDDPKYLKLVATAKHYAAHNGPEVDRFAFDAQVSRQDMEDTFLPAFEASVREAGVESVMGAYNRLNGVPACADPWLLQTVLRDQWGFEGYVVSDCGAIENMVKAHQTYASDAEAAAASVKAGCDLCCGCAYHALVDAVQQGLLTEADLDVALTRLYRALFRLGFFDPEERVPYASLPVDVVECDEHRTLAYEAAVKSIVLLENDGFLPMASTINQVMVTGPNADAMDVLLGNYSGFGSPMSTILEGIVQTVSVGTRVGFTAGCAVSGSGIEGYGMVGWESKGADVIIACLGITPKLEGEEGDTAAEDAGADRRSMGLPASQERFLRYLDTLEIPVVVVLTGGTPVVLPDGLRHVRAVLMAWYPGAEGGRAVAEILFGQVSPGGRLPCTFPRLDADLPPIGDYDMSRRTYRYDASPVKYPFGYGLSYTTFATVAATLSRSTVGVGEGFAVDVTVANTGGVAADEVVQVYVRANSATGRVPRHALAGFARVSLAPGEERTVTVPIAARALTYVDADGVRRAEPGQFTVWAGGGQPGTDARPVELALTVG